MQNDIRIAFFLSKKFFRQKFAGTTIGVVWALVMPSILLGVYSFIYGRVFLATWVSESAVDNYSLNMYVGLTIFLFCAEVLNSSTVLIEQNASLVKKSPINVNLFPVALVLASFYSFVISNIPFLFAYAFVVGIPPITAIMYFPLMLVYMVFLMGCSFVIASIAPYFKDLKQVMALFTTVLMFFSPIFFNQSQLPKEIQDLLKFVNPLAFFIQTERALIFDNQLPQVIPTVAFASASLFIWFVGQKTYSFLKTGFADVI
jgi:lipopolysaccharide transport system permease protein